MEMLKPESHCQKPKFQKPFKNKIEIQKFNKCFRNFVKTFRFRKDFFAKTKFPKTLAYFGAVLRLRVAQLVDDINPVKGRVEHTYKLQPKTHQNHL